MNANKEVWGGASPIYLGYKEPGMFVQGGYYNGTLGFVTDSKFTYSTPLKINWSDYDVNKLSITKINNTDYQYIYQFIYPSGNYITTIDVWNVQAGITALKNAILSRTGDWYVSVKTQAIRSVVIGTYYGVEMSLQP